MTTTTRDAVLERLDEYDALLRRHCGTSLSESVVLELRRSEVPRAAPSAWQIDPADDAWLRDGPPNGSVDLVVAEAALEHVDATRLMRLAPRMARWLHARGLALVRSGGGWTPTQYRALFALDFELLEERADPDTGSTLFALAPLPS